MTDAKNVERAGHTPEIGDRRTIVEELLWRECDQCGEPAKYQQTYLLKGTRSNPNSSAYGRDDCSHCSDSEIFVCEEHKDWAWHNPPDGYVDCARISLNEHYKHLGQYWEKISTQYAAIKKAGA